MLITLFFILLVFTLLDIGLSGIAMRLGGSEIGPIFLICNDWQLTTFIKGIAIFLLGLILVSYKQKGLLAISCLIVFLCCFWNGWLLQKTFG